MSDQTGEAAETGDFGAGADAPGGGATDAPGGATQDPKETSQDERPSITSAPADRQSGTAYKPADLDRPAPSDEPLRVLFGKEE